MRDAVLVGLHHRVTRDCLHDGVKCRAVRIRSIGTKSAHRTHDELRVDLSQDLPAHTQSFESAGAKILYDHVCCRHEPFQQRLAFLCLEVKSDRSLIAVHRREKRTNSLCRSDKRTGAAHDVGRLGLLNHDHISPLVGEDRCTERSRDHGRKIDDTNATQGTTVPCSRPSVRTVRSFSHALSFGTRMANSRAGGCCVPRCYQLTGSPFGFDLIFSDRERCPWFLAGLVEVCG